MSLIRRLGAAAIAAIAEPAPQSIAQAEAANSAPPPPPPPPPPTLVPAASSMEPQPAALPVLDAEGTDAAFIAELLDINTRRKAMEKREEALKKHLLGRVLTLGAGELRTETVSLILVPATQRVEAARPSKVVTVAARVTLKLAAAPEEALVPAVPAVAA